jgi:2,7-dihydroxy-5-methyl-1-naphthoate 7-O-methyltransferase
MSDQPDIWAMADLATPWSLRTVVTLRIPERLAAGDASAEELARAADCDAQMLSRVLRHLTGRGVFTEPEPGTFALTDAGRTLTDPSLRPGFDLDGIGGRMAGAFGTLLTAVRTGRPAYHTAFGRSFWDDLEANPAVADSFDELMGPTGHGVPDPDVLPSGDWSGIRRVVDVGGGTGGLLAEVLRARPDIKGTLVELPRVVAGAGAVFDAAGVADRATVAGQSFFDPLPAGADLYLLKSVLADWPDAEATALLRRCAEAARPAGRIVVLSGVSPDSVPVGEFDLMMMVLLGGKERTLTEFRELAAAAGLDVAATGRNAAGRYLVECCPR